MVIYNPSETIHCLGVKQEFRIASPNEDLSSSGGSEMMNMQMQIKMEPGLVPEQPREYLGRLSGAAARLHGHG